MGMFFDNLNMAPVVGFVMDDSGFAKFDVYFLREVEEKKKLIPFLPTPQVEFIDKRDELDYGGDITIDQVMLKNIPVRSFSEDELRGVFNPPQRQFIVVKSPQKLVAFSVQSLESDEIFWTIFLSRYKSINKNELEGLL